MLPKLTALAAATILVVACSQNEASTTSDSNTQESFNQDQAKAAIDSSNEAFGTAFAKGDSATLVNFYLDDAKVYPPNMPAMDDYGMGSLATQIPKMGISTTKLQAQEVLGGPDYAVEVGTYKMGDSAKDLDVGKYIVVWKKENGKWKMYRDIWNSDNPPPTAQK